MNGRPEKSIWSPSNWLIFFALLAAACAAVFHFWFSSTGLHATHKQGVPEQPGNLSDEPITPIPETVKLDARKVALGRRLFFDKRLSADSQASCSSCHDLSRWGTDGALHPAGPDPSQGSINTLSVFNSGYNYRLLWDGRFATLEDLVEFPLQHAGAMTDNWPKVIARIEHDPDYVRDFSTIYPEGIGQRAIKDVIAVYVRSLTTPDSRFDRYLRGDATALDSEERAGYELFKNLGCISCHQGRNVGGNMYEKLGLVGNYFENRGNIRKTDYGRYNVTGNEEDRYEFRVPSLRNVALTGPYFHDASANTLELAVATMAKYQLGVDLSNEEVRRIVRFLNTLTGHYKGQIEP